jgi:DNA-binding transcriptional ArsR family regulator
VCATVGPELTSAVVNRACASAKTSTGNGIAILSMAGSTMGQTGCCSTCATMAIPYPSCATPWCNLKVRQTTVSHHLKVLRDRGLVTATREGNAVRYTLRDRRIIRYCWRKSVSGGGWADVLAERAKLAGAIAQ